MHREPCPNVQWTTWVRPCALNWIPCAVLKGCDKPFCAKSIVTCNPVSGLEATFTFYDAFEAPDILCRAVDPDDVCTAPSYCVAGAAQCSAPSRSPLNLTRHGVDGVCPSISKVTAHSCWSQRTHDSGLAGALLYSANERQLSVRVPQTVNASCNALPVTPRYQFFLIACKYGAVECSDEQIPCPSTADPSQRWWEGFADTLAASALGVDTEFTGNFPSAMDRTIHAVIHVWEPEGSPLNGSSVICLSRTHVDTTPPIPNTVRHTHASRLVATLEMAYCHGW